jgi:hypothetical protein
MLIIKILDFIYKTLFKPLLIILFTIYYKFSQKCHKHKISRVRNPIYFKSARELVKDIKNRKVNRN